MDSEGRAEVLGPRIQQGQEYPNQNLTHGNISHLGAARIRETENASWVSRPALTAALWQRNQARRQCCA